MNTWIPILANHNSWILFTYCVYIKKGKEKGKEERKKKEGRKKKEEKDALLRCLKTKWLSVFEDHYPITYDCLSLRNKHAVFPE